MVISKHYRVFLLLGVFGFAGLIFPCYHQRASNLAYECKNVSRYRYPKPRHDIRGFRFDGTHEGKKTISIKADRFSIDKKKLGFFRFGLMNVARLENAFIHIYGSRGLPGKNPDESHSNIKSRQSLTFKNVFSKEALPSFPIKRISSIVMEPVYVELHDEQSVVTRISAASAAIRLKKGDILLKGNVRVASGARVLTTDQLSMLPEKAIVKTDQHFVLKTPEEQYEGDHLTTDIFLRSGTPIQSRSPLRRVGFTSWRLIGKK